MFERIITAKLNIIKPLFVIRSRGSSAEIVFFTMSTSYVIVQMEIVKFCIVESGDIIRFICFSP